MRKVYIILLFTLSGFLNNKISAQTANTSPLPSGVTVIGNHLNVGYGNEVWTDNTSNALYFNYRGTAQTTYFWNLAGSTGKYIMALQSNGNSFFSGNLNVAGDLNGNGKGYFNNLLQINAPGSRSEGLINLYRNTTLDRALVAFGESGSNKWYNGLMYNGGGESNAFCISQKNMIRDSQGNPFNPEFTILQSGNIGVGVINPTNKLEVNGTIRCQEVLVEASPWPDYVFAKDYKLKSITEVANYIKANNHLPDMPAATEVEQNGVKLSELNTKLLQKVEELTLYLIEQNKQIEDLKKENKQIKELIKPNK